MSRTDMKHRLRAKPVAGAIVASLVLIVGAAFVLADRGDPIGRTAETGRPCIKPSANADVVVGDVTGLSGRRGWLAVRDFAPADREVDTTSGGSWVRLVDVDYLRGTEPYLVGIDAVPIENAIVRVNDDVLGLWSDARSSGAERAVVLMDTSDPGPIAINVGWAEWSDGSIAPLGLCATGNYFDAEFARRLGPTEPADIGATARAFMGLPGADPELVDRYNAGG